jgi:hypothetical protein
MNQDAFLMKGLDNVRAEFRSALKRMTKALGFKTGWAP